MLLKKNYQLNIPNINVDYNFISVPRFLHVLLHLIRFIEFMYYEDFHFCYNCGFSGYLKQNDLTKTQGFDLSNIQKKLKQKPVVGFNLKSEIETLLNYLKQEIPSFANQKENMFLSKKRKKAFKDNLNPSIKSSFQKVMVWENLTYGLEITILPDEVELIRDLIKKLIVRLESFFQENPNISKPKNWKTRQSNTHKARLHGYLTGYRNETDPFFGWKLKNPNSAMTQRQNQSYYRKKRGVNLNPIYDDMLTNGGYIWYNEKYPNIEPVKVTPDRFFNLTALVDCCIQKLPKQKQPQRWFSNSADSRNSVVKDFVGVMLNKPKSCSYGWKVKKDDSLRKT